MTFSDEILMAYADGELGEPVRSLVEGAARDDPAVAAAIARHRALRADVFAAFAGVMDEPVPARLRQAATAPNTRPANIRSLDAARERRATAQGAGKAANVASAAEAASAAGARSRAWGRWGALAASLAVGVLAGSFLPGAPGGTDAAYAALDAGGGLVAQGELDSALSRQLAGTAQAGGPVRIGVSFTARDGGYCRSFTVDGNAGLACREGDSWRIPILREVPSDAAAYRQAASATPSAVLEVIDERIDGPALDAAAERAARDRGWKR